jgi:hypothetical protein
MIILPPPPAIILPHEPAPKSVLSGYFMSRVLNPDGSQAKDGEWRFFKNGTTTLGHNYLLNTSFRNTTQSASWFTFLIAQGGYSQLLAADTSASHSGWAEETQYSGNRPAWSPPAASSGTLITSAVSYVATADIEVRGAGLANSNAKGSTTDLIYSTAVESTFRSIANGGTYQLIYYITLTAA